MLVFARYLRTNPRTLENWEQGRAKPNAQAILLIRMVSQSPDTMSPFRKWYDSLDPQGSTKVSVALERIELGIHSRIKWFRGIGEYVLDWGPGYRIYLLLDGDKVIVLLAGGTKSRQQKDIERALDYAQQHKARRKI